MAIPSLPFFLAASALLVKFPPSGYILSLVIFMAAVSIHRQPFLVFSTPFQILQALHRLNVKHIWFTTVFRFSIRDSPRWPCRGRRCRRLWRPVESLQLEWVPKILCWNENIHNANHVPCVFEVLSLAPKDADALRAKCFCLIQLSQVFPSRLWAIWLCLTEMLCCSTQRRCK